MEQEDECNEPMPKNIYWINPNLVACSLCNYRNAYFECGHELEHDCENENNTEPLF